MKIFVLFTMVLFVASANGRVSNELVTVKASYEFGIEEERNLLDIYDASVTDSGDILTVALNSKTVEKTCVDWYWYNYYGDLADCPDCDDDSDMCFCVVGHCDNNRTGQRTIRKKRLHR